MNSQTRERDDLVLETRRGKLGGLSAREAAEALGIDTSPSEIVVLDASRLSIIAAHVRSREEFVESNAAAWDDPIYWNVGDSRRDRSQYMAIGNAINFRFWRLRDGDVVPSVGIIDGVELRGSMYMWRSLRRCLDNGTHPILDAKFLAKITGNQFDDIFVDDAGLNPLDVARDERIENLRDLGEHLEEAWAGNFYDLVRATNGSLVEFARLSGQFRAFDDPIYKLTMVNAIMHAGSGVYAFLDDPLPGIDYQLMKHLLRQGVLRPSAEMAEKLTEGRLLDHEEAYELRRVSLAAFIHLSSETGLGGALLDNRYWLNRVNCKDQRPVCEDPATESQCPFLEACARLTYLGHPLEMTRYY